MVAKNISLDHGSGGVAGNSLIRDRIIARLPAGYQDVMEDSALFSVGAETRLAFSTDSYVVDPLFFPGGDIGKLAVHGTINDIAMRGAEPICLSLAMIVEEGFSLAEFDRIVESIGQASCDASVPVVTGDTKVVPKGGCDRIFINTSGVGVLSSDSNISASNARKGDRIIVSGDIGDHGITIMTSRAGISIAGNMRSDTAPLHRMVKGLVHRLPHEALHVMRDPTRGGIASALNEIADASHVHIEINEEAIPVAEEIFYACEMLGLDPLYLANEGKMLLFVAEGFEEDALKIMHSFDEGRKAAIIGTVTDNDDHGRVVMRTAAGGKRIVSALYGNPLPRIC
jgi:hydrogenase expression/formation protein HypE